jgi:hypothetical protein
MEAIAGSKFGYPVNFSQYILAICEKIPNTNFVQWKRISRKQSARWQKISRLKASVFFSLQRKMSC